MARAINPILKGFYPDPSICTDKLAFYLVNSTFSYFPGVPIFQSYDLAHWKQIGNILTRNSQLPLENLEHSQGIYAPTLRYHEGVFYMIATNVGHGDNFLVTATNPAGPWSEPHFLGEAAPGFDPSLFFDEDGTCYYVGTRANPGGIRYNGDYEVWVSKLDLSTFSLVGESKAIWKGALRDCIWPEGPHIYKKDGRYYVMIAEGGTCEDHCVTIARSESIWGPYENNPKNPILTHRHLGHDYPIQAVGHGDLVETSNHDWFMVMLATRPIKRDGLFITLMGRETFLAKVIWEDGWPIVNPGAGTLTKEVETGISDAFFDVNGMISDSCAYHFYTQDIPKEMLMLRNPQGDELFLDRDVKKLRLNMCAATLLDTLTPAYVCIRQATHDFFAQTHFEMYTEDSDGCAGLCYMQSNLYHVRMEAYENEQKNAFIRLISCKDGIEKIEKNVPISQKQKTVSLYLACRNGYLYAGYELENGNKEEVISNMDVSFLGTQTAGGFTGCTIGMYASANGKNISGYALFKDFFCHAI